jgi:hypothetical protein
MRMPHCEPGLFMDAQGLADVERAMGAVTSRIAALARECAGAA